MGNGASRVRTRVERDGRFLRLDDAPFRVRGVTYGSFRSRLDGQRFPDRHQIKEDLAAIARVGLNTVRTYELPPPELVETAEELELRLIVGLDYPDWRMESQHGRSAHRRVLDAGRRAVGVAMEALDSSPSVLAIAVGNEIPVDLVRLNGTRAIQDVLSELIADVHEADPEMLATYVNFPTTEFLEPLGQDLISFNVFLEEPSAFRRYINHLHVLAGEKPLLITELGMASEIHGDAIQAESVAWQLNALDEAGCAGATVFSWTDEWAVDDEDVGGWGFGLTTVDRDPKPALDVVAEWAEDAHPLRLRGDWPRISVVVCAYNEEATIAGCLESLLRCDYPELEVIICDDGSIDSTLEIACRFPFEVLALPHRGLSSTRNAGIEVASGEIIAFLDADAACHEEWPYHLAMSMESPEVAATGGPNLPFRQVGFAERAISHSPGSAAEVLVSDDRAEHVPGCNMAFRASELRAVGGFDNRYVSAGDDVDVCWKILDRGGSIAFSPAAQVHHHRRSTVLGYLKQQKGYGRAERMLSGSHPHRFNLLGQARWSGVVYGGSPILPTILRPVVYTGYMGMAPFQPIVERPSEVAGAWATALLPLVVPLAAVGAALTLVSTLWLLLPLVLLLLMGAYGVTIAGAIDIHHSEPRPRRLRALVGLLHVLQPMARTWGRVTGRPARPVTPVVSTGWVGDRAAWLTDLERALEANDCDVLVAPPGTNHDLRVRKGPFTSARITTAVVWAWEPRYRVSYRPRLYAVALAIAAVALAAAGSVWAWWAVGGTTAAVANSVFVLRGDIREACLRTV